ncbi:geranylgeranyl pyrophosphate synthase [Halobacteroides halobius DSM 5150]|uniref:Geranylgeranyl pyrophosphate synthase n=1 Tax=Halobacteroides halobius (strain ATCC 35273 / DSM 5150 / MD-1) TaxID=748449 RepID=L0KBD5_HALHC|nr:polyprenyl synthetase family protein [Halobacteroides halobius]AGB41694.1 geranylgeranyl pyrophosphate synthase [Halobacteroides halobius DSM 5150]
MSWDQLTDELDDFEEYLHKFLVSGQPLIQESIIELANAGGKRIRPLLVIITAQFGDYKKEKVWPVAAAIELLHMATLVHDDIIDSSNLRRGIKTVQSRCGKDIAVFTGDYLFSLTFNILSEHTINKHLGLVSKVIKLICEEEIKQYQDRYNVELTYKDYFKRVENKTAILFETSCTLGAELGKIRQSNQDNLARYGRYLGMAFQVTDDLLDFTESIAKLGKPGANDFTQGVYTLPILYVLKETKCAAQLEELLEAPISNKEAIEKIIKDTSALDYTSEVAKNYIQQAKAELNSMPSDYNRERLLFLANQVLERNF